jgi:hypothetical protein
MKTFARMDVDKKEPRVFHRGSVLSSGEERDDRIACAAIIVSTPPRRLAEGTLGNTRLFIEPFFEALFLFSFLLHSLNVCRLATGAAKGEIP